GGRGDAMTASPILLASFTLEGVSARWAWMWLLLVLGGAAFLWWTYHGIYQRTSRRLAWWLMALRGLGLLLLVLMLSRRTGTRAKDEVESGRVAVVVDTSRSMTLPDASGRARYARAKDAVVSLRKKLSPRLQIDLFDVNGSAVKELPAEPDADFTDLTRCLR